MTEGYIKAKFLKKNKKGKRFHAKNERKKKELNMRRLYKDMTESNLFANMYSYLNWCYAYGFTAIEGPGYILLIYALT